MRTLTNLLLAAVWFSFGTTSFGSENIDREDGVVYLTSTRAGQEEAFVIYRDGSEMEIEYWANSGNGYEKLEDRDYSISNVDLIVFMGDNDTDELHFSFEGYFNADQAIFTPVIAYGFGGDDLLYGGQGACELHGGDGNDTLAGSFGDDFLDAGDSVNETIWGLGGADTFVKWQAYLYHHGNGGYGYQDYQSLDTDFDAATGDVWEIRRKAMPNKKLIMNGGQLPLQDKPTVKKTDLSSLIAR